MKYSQLVRNLYFLLVLIFGLPALCSAQTPPPEQWALHYGGSNVDIPFAIKFTSDGGTVVAGYTDSKDGDVAAQPNREYWDLWVVKLDRCGAIQWEKSYGGTGYDNVFSIHQTSDNGFIVAGVSNSNDGNIGMNHGLFDYWVLKLTGDGTIQWAKTSLERFIRRPRS